MTGRGKLTTGSNHCRKTEVLVEVVEVSSVHVVGVGAEDTAMGLIGVNGTAVSSSPDGVEPGWIATAVNMGSVGVVVVSVQVVEVEGGTTAFTSVEKPLVVLVVIVSVHVVEVEDGSTASTGVEKIEVLPVVVVVLLLPVVVSVQVVEVEDCTTALTGVEKVDVKPVVVVVVVSVHVVEVEDLNTGLTGVSKLDAGPVVVLSVHVVEVGDWNTGATGVESTAVVEERVCTTGLTGVE